MPSPRIENERRSCDRGSGIGCARTLDGTRRRRKRELALPPPHASEEDSSTESEAGETVQTEYKYGNRREKAPGSHTKRDRGSSQQQRSGNQKADAEHVEKPEQKAESPGFNLLLAMARHYVPVPIRYNEPSYYVPDCANMFVVVQEIGDTLADNIKLFSFCPDFTTIGLSLYYAHVYYYQILRAREQVGTNTRFDRRTLRIYESIASLESWPIAAPLIDFVQALGAVSSSDGMFSTISPAFPDFSLFTENNALRDLHLVKGIGRTPIIPAIQEFLRLCGTKQAFYDTKTATYRPVETPLNQPTKTFLGITESTASTHDYQTLVHSSSWNKPAEIEDPIGYFSTSQRQTQLLRWSIPCVNDTANFKNSMETYLFGDQNHIKWMRNLLRIASAANQFIPGSTNLSDIPCSTRLETLSPISVGTAIPCVAVADAWYAERNIWCLSVKVRPSDDEAEVFGRAAARTATNMVYEGGVVPGGLEGAFDACWRGPYFQHCM